MSRIKAICSSITYKSCFKRRRYIFLNPSLTLGVDYSFLLTEQLVTESGPQERAPFL